MRKPKDTEDKKARFIAFMADNDRPMAACKHTDIHPSTYYHWLERDPEFVKQLDYAKKWYRDKIVGIVQSRIVDGVVIQTRTYWDKALGANVSEEKKQFSDSLLAMEGKRVEQGYREKDPSINVGIGISGALLVPPTLTITEYREVLEQHRLENAADERSRTKPE